jgi:polar amino acid transport system permease protein
VFVLEECYGFIPLEREKLMAYRREIERTGPDHNRWLWHLSTIDRWWVLVLAVLGLIGMLVWTQPAPFRDILLFLADGILVTLQVTALAFVFTLVVGLLGGLGRLSRNPLIRGVTSLYVEVVRGIPLLVQLLYIYFALPQIFDAIGGMLAGFWPGGSAFFIQLSLTPVAAAVLGLTVCYGAYMSEIFRAGIQSIHHGQMEAARSLGMSYVQGMRYVILPQAIRVILPPVGNEFVNLLKDSSLVSIMAVSDITRRGREYMSRTFLSIETWTMVALVYLVFTLTFSRLVTALERKMTVER